MAEVLPLRGVRYDSRRLANIGRLIAPPYDTTDVPERDDQAPPSSFNIAALENVDLAAGADSHLLAAARYRDWRQQGFLRRDEAAALYVHDHHYRDGGRPRQRRGLLARVRLADWSERVILPHERTMPGPRQERLERLRAVRANLSPLYLLYHDPAGDVRRLLGEAMTAAGPIATGVDVKADRHQLTALADIRPLQTLTELFAGQTLFVADGHHRYEAALAYRDEQRRGGADSAAPSEFVLAMLADIEDPGVTVRPTHRLVQLTAGFDRARFRQRLSDFFVVDPDGSGDRSGLDRQVCEIHVAGDIHPWRIVTRPDRAHEAALPPDRSQAWRALPVAIADSVILDSILGVRADQVTYTHEANTARLAVASGGASLALVFAPPSLLALERVAAAGDQLPPKSSYFDPKPPAGLVINDLAE